MRQKKQILMMACLLGLAGLVSSLPVQTQAYTVAVQQQGRSGGTEEEQARKARYEAKYGAPYGVSWVERNQRKEPNRAVSRRTSSQLLRMLVSTALTGPRSCVVYLQIKQSMNRIVLKLFRRQQDQ